MYCLGTTTGSASAAGTLSSLKDVLEALRAAAPMAMVFDDCHIISNPLVHHIWRELVYRRPPGINLLLLGRTPLPVPLSKLRAQGLVRDIRGTALRFTDHEARDYLHRHRVEPVDDPHLRFLCQRAEGWPVWLQFAEQAGAQPPLEAHATWHQVMSLVDAYVAEEMLDQIDPELATFMLDVTDLPVLRTDVIAHAFERDDAGQILQQLVHTWQWLEPVAGQDLSFRFPASLHASLRRLAHHRLFATHRHRRSERAIDWFEQHGNLEHALEMSIRTHHWGRAQKLVRNDAQEMFDASLMQELIAFLERLPLEQILCHRELGFWFTIAAIVECREDLARKCIRLAEREHAEVHGSGRLALYLALMATLDFDRTGALEHARNARRDLEADDRHWANLVLWVWDHRAENAQAFARPAEHSRWTRLPWQTPWWQRVMVPAYANHLAHLGDVAGAVSQYDALLQTPGEQRTRPGSSWPRGISCSSTWPGPKPTFAGSITPCQPTSRISTLPCD
jgi:ATP/maltotriose-dependent transcriptional regulator MalT